MGDLDQPKELLLRRKRLWPLAGGLLSFVLALALTGSLVFDHAAQQKWSSSPDSITITRLALQADGVKIASWWYGPWIEAEMYYRPLSSMLMWLEARLWGYNYLPYTIISWLMHGVNSLLLCLLLFSICPGPRWQRAALGVFGALMFNLGQHPPGPYWEQARVTWGVMIWWPVQTDLGSMMFSLLSLIMLDRYLVGRRLASKLAANQLACRGDGDDAESRCAPRPNRTLPTLALLSFLAALLFKETPLVLIAIVPFLALYRNRPWLLLTLGYAAIGVVLVVLRAYFVPGASNPEWMGTYTFFKLLNYIHLLSAQLLISNEVWEFIAMATIIAVVWGLRRLRVPFPYIALTCLIWPPLMAWLFSGDHNPALATISREMGIEARLLGVFIGFLLSLVTAGTEPVLIFIVGLCAIAAANVNRIGPHYWYWPVAFWGMIDAAVLGAALNLWRYWRQAQPTQVEAATTHSAAENS